MDRHELSRRDFMKVLGVAAVAVRFSGPFDNAQAADIPDIAATDRVFIANEDSNTISVINPATNTVETTINLTSFDEDIRPPLPFCDCGDNAATCSNDT